MLTVVASLSYILFAQELELIFSHKYHAEEVSVACTDCHLAETSTSPTDNLLPDMERCYTCHDKDNTECTICHKDPDNAIVYPRVTSYIAKFSHQKHSGETFNCETCHSGVNKSSDVQSKHISTMSQCVQCHENNAKGDYCYTCHNTSENLEPADHSLAWEDEHGIVAGMAKENCSVCHQLHKCDKCHEGDNLDRKVHRLNFVNNHGISAKGNKDNCLTCHEEQAFCMDCHSQRMVMPRNHSRANWSNTTTGGVHARAAKLDLDNCMSCHSNAVGDPVCVVCHQ